jgi:autotransporter strand-loop-strand O-heptosyltransferase
MNKIIIITPHLSTGGQPQYVLKKIEVLKDQYEVFCIEYSYLSSHYVIQRNKIKNLLGSNFYSVGESNVKLSDIIDSINPDIIWIEEIGETFLSNDDLNIIYKEKRQWKIIETTHTSVDLSFKKLYLPDKFIFVSDWSKNHYVKFNIDITTLQYPIEVKDKNDEYYKNLLNFDRGYKHVLNVGLFTPGKNQGYIFELARKLLNYNVKFHFVGNLADNFKEYWEPLIKNIPSNCILHGEKDNIDDYIQACDLFLFTSKFELNPLVIKEALCYNDLPILMFNLETYCGQYDNNSRITYLSGDINNDINLIIKKMNLQEFKDKMISEIDSTTINDREIIKQINISNHFVGNPFLEITGNIDDEYNIKFKDGDKIIHNTILKNNMWTKLNRKYYTNWNVEVTNSEGLIIYENQLNLENKRVYIAFNSKSLGDTLAWIPYVEEFRKKHNCELIVSTFMNDLFEETYPEITFVKPGEIVGNLYAMYELGWYYDDKDNIDYDRVPNNFRVQPLQKTASDILGLEFKEIKPILKLRKDIIKKKKVGIAIHSTAQAKYWNNKNGWQEVVDYLKSKGYEITLYSIEQDGYMGNYHPKGIKQYPKKPMQEMIYDMQSCEFFIGISSGLSWLAWSVNIPVILISGFSESYTEPTSNIFRIINNKVCTGCFNTHKLNPNDWNWCPIYKNTEKQFECTKNIKSEDIISEIKKIIS